MKNDAASTAYGIALGSVDATSMSSMSAHIQGHGQGFLAVYLLIATDESVSVK